MPVRSAVRAAVGGLLITLAACSSSGSASSGAASSDSASSEFGGAPLSEVTTTTDPTACAERQPDGTWSEDCYAARYDQARVSLSAPELADLGAADLDGRIDALCSAAEGVSGAATMRAEQLRSLIDEDDWSPAALAQLTTLARNRCPNDFVEIDRMPGLAQSVLVGYRIEGTGSATIRWVNASGQLIEESTVGPWYGEVRLDDPMDMRVDAIFDDGTDRSCALLVDGEVIVSHTLPDSAEFPELRCSLSGAEIEFGTLSAPGGDSDSEN